MGRTAAAGTPEERTPAADIPGAGIPAADKNPLGILSIKKPKSIEQNQDGFFHRIILRFRKKKKKKICKINLP